MITPDIIWFGLQMIAVVLISGAISFPVVLGLLKLLDAALERR